jgi:hypothetical protein
MADRFELEVIETRDRLARQLTGAGKDEIE